MPKLDQMYVTDRAGIRTAITVKSHDYDVVEFSVSRLVYDDKDKLISSTKIEMFPTYNELKALLQPLVNDLKEIYDTDKHTESQ